MGGFSSIFHRVGDLVSHPVKISKDLVTHPSKGFSELKGLYTHNEHEDQKLFNGLGIHGWVGKHPQETAAAVVGTIFGGWAAWGAMGTGAAGGAGAATGASTGAASTAAPISAASGTLTPAGVSMGGQAAVDSNMVAGAGSETALGNLFQGFGGSNVVGGSSWQSWAQNANRANNMLNQNQQGQQQPQQQLRPQQNSLLAGTIRNAQAANNVSGGEMQPNQYTTGLAGNITQFNGSAFQNAI